MRLPAPLTQGSLWGGAKKTPRRGCLLEYGGLFAAALFVLQAAAAGAGVIAAGLLFIGLHGDFLDGAVFAGGQGLEGLLPLDLHLGTGRGQMRLRLP